MKKLEILNTKKIVARALRSLFFDGGRLLQDGHFIQLSYITYLFLVCDVNFVYNVHFIYIV